MTTLAPSITPGKSFPLLCLLIGIVGTALCTSIFFRSPDDFFEAYLFAWIFWLGISLGATALCMLHNLTGGEWGTLLRPIATAASLTIPLLTILFIPIALGARHVFPWARPETLAESALLLHRKPYLNLPFFFARAIAYFFIWNLFIFQCRRLARRYAETGREAYAGTLRAWSAIGLVLYMLAMTNASIDWIMSRDVEFYSTTFGFILTVGQTLSALAFAIIALALLHGFSALARKTKPGVFNDVGNILLTLVILWAYVSFMQLLVIWMGNTHDDNTYYLHRGWNTPGLWRWIGAGLILLHFFIPFFVLLFRATKRYAPALTTIAALLFIAHVAEQYWLIAPSTDPTRALPRLADGLVFVTIGAFFCALFVFILRRIPASPALPASLHEGQKEAPLAS